MNIVRCRISHKATFPRERAAQPAAKAALSAPQCTDRAESRALDAVNSSLFSHGLAAIMESVTEWSYDKVLQLIALFQQRPMLWDTRCITYKDRQKRHEVTLELAARFNVEKDEIERKLKNLQSHFYREFKREELSKSSGGTGSIGVYRSKWFAYNAMKFLADKSKPRRSHIQLATRQKPKTARVSIIKHGDKSRIKKSGKKKNLFKFQVLYFLFLDIYFPHDTLNLFFLIFQFL